MDVSRILVIQEEADPPREMRLLAFGNPVEFEFRSFGRAVPGTAELDRYDAIVASLDSEHRALIESIRGKSESIPPLFLFRSDPPLQEVARWVAWTKTREGEDPAVAARLLSESVEYYSLASLYQKCLKIMSSQDEEKLLSHATETFSHELGVESCVIWLASPSDPDEMLIASVRGVISIDREGSRFFLSQSDFGERAMEGKPFLEDPVAVAGERSGIREQHLYVPLMHRERPIGMVKLGARTERKIFRERDLYVARIIADYAASAWRNVNRLARMEKVSLRDAETRAYSPAFLADYFEKERYKAGRFRRPLSLVFLVVENLSFLMERTRETLVTSALSGMVEAVEKVLRDSDLIARIEPNRFCVVLPETDSFGALLAARRLRKAIREPAKVEYLGFEYPLETYLVTATYPRDGRELRDLRRIAEEKYQRQRKSPFHRMHLGEKSLWNAFDALVGRREYYDLLRAGKEVPYFSRIRRSLGRNGHFLLDRQTFLRMLDSLAQDVSSLNGSRGLVIAAGPRPEIYKQIFFSFGTQGGQGRNIYIVGRGGSTRFDAKNLLYVTAEDEQLQDRSIVLFLKENGAYGLFAEERGDECFGFNTTDEVLVDSMMEKIQNLYHLQGNF
ncbi:MAG: hypothetical protein Kow00128_10790 [Deltaproteobacteria bacterium]